MPPKLNTTSKRNTTSGTGRSKKQQQHKNKLETVEIVECKINNFISGSKSDDDDISDDDTVNIYVDSVRSKQKLKEDKPVEVKPIVPTALPTGLAGETSSNSVSSKLKRIPRGKTARIEPTVNPPQQDGDNAIDYFKMCNEYKEQLDKLLETKKVETTIKAFEIAQSKKSELDLRRESFKLKFG